MNCHLFSLGELRGDFAAMTSRKNRALAHPNNKTDFFAGASKNQVKGELLAPFLRPKNVRNLCVEMFSLLAL